MTSEITNSPLAAEDFFWRERACQHHWRIEPANGPTSWGRCIRCGDSRQFSNDPEMVLIQPPGK